MVLSNQSSPPSDSALNLWLGFCGGAHVSVCVQGRLQRLLVPGRLCARRLQGRFQLRALALLLASNRLSPKPCATTQTLTSKLSRWSNKLRTCESTQRS